jgi:hypothetical protein
MSNPFRLDLSESHEAYSVGYILDPYWEQLEMQFLLLMEVAMGERKIKWKHTRLNWKEHVEQLLHEESFDNQYRMSLEAFTTLVDLLRPMITPNIIKSLNSCPDPTYPEMVVAVGIRWLAGGSYLDLKTSFGISRSSVFRLRDMFVDAIRFPDTPEEIEKVRGQFEAKSTNRVMRGCVGAMDGMFAKIKQPFRADSNGNPRSFHSGHYNDYGLNVQAICDARLRFLNFAVAAPGRTGDLVAYELITIRETIEKLPTGFYIVADAAYMLTEHVLVPFTGGDRSASDKDTFNYYLSQLRIRIEMAFGLLTNKWRVLRKHLETNLENSSRVLEACARLHNFVIDQDEDDDFGNDPKSVDVIAMDDSPLAWGYLPTVEPLETIPGTSTVRDAILAHVTRNGYRRPAENVERRELELHELDPPLM